MKWILGLFHPLKAILGFSWLERWAQIWGPCQGISPTPSTSPPSVPVFQPGRVINGASADLHQSVLSPSFIDRGWRMRQQSSAVNRTASVPSVILALSPHIKALRACIIELTSVLVRNLILYSPWGPRLRCVTTDREEKKGRDGARRPLKPCNNCGFTLWAWQAALLSGPGPS